MPDSIRVLLVDDDEEDYIITNDIISDIPRKYRLEWASSYKEAEKIIAENRHHVYLIDYRLGADSGLELIKSCKENGVTAPMILMTGQGDVEIDEEAMKAGASDYLVKGSISASELDRSIRYSIKEAGRLEEIRQLNSELEKRVQERTEELFAAIKKLEETNKIQKKAEEEVRKSLAKEKELNELKSRFVTMASHEFRTPLSTILSSVSLIQKYNEMGENDKLVKHTQRIKSAVTNLTGILNDFLSLSKLEEGNISFHPQEFNFKELLEEIVEEMTPVIKETQKLVSNYEGAELINSDKNILRNCILNLVSNAVKYSEKGTIRINTMINKDKINITVSDEGIGIPEKDQLFLFTRFFRAHNSGNIQGTGLGLNIVKRYIELLKGSITFKSIEFQGTTFYIEIPQN